MEPIGIFSQDYSVVTKGINLNQIDHTVSANNLTINVRPGDEPAKFLLKITINGVTEADGSSLAKRASEDFLRSVIFEFPDKIQSIIAPEAKGPRFEYYPNQGGPMRVCIVANEWIRVMDGGELGPFCPNTSQIDDLKRRFENALTLSQLPTNARLYSARDLFYLAMQSENKSVRYLSLYSAATLAALFHNSGNGSQDAVDALLLSKNPNIPCALTGRTKTGKPKTETLYTKLRNDLVHAEERGCAPDTAQMAMEQSVLEFQRDVALLII